MVITGGVVIIIGEGVVIAGGVVVIIGRVWSFFGRGRGSSIFSTRPSPAPQDTLPPRKFCLGGGVRRKLRGS